MSSPKTVLVFCAERTNKPSTKEIIRNLYGNSPVNAIYTGSKNRPKNNSSGNITVLNLPLSPWYNNYNARGFTFYMKQILGNKKVDAFIFEGCPLGYLFNYRNWGKVSSNGVPRSPTFNRNVLNVLRTFSKNNSIVTTAWGKYKNISNRLLYNRNIPTPSLNRLGVVYKAYRFKKARTT